MRPARRTGAPDRRSAFTLIEILVLIIIMAVISSVMVPAYSRFYANARFNQRVHDLVGLLTWARDQAIQTQNDTTVHYDAQNGTFTISVQAPTLTTDLPQALQPQQDTAAPLPESRMLNLGDDMAVGSFAVGGDQSSGAASQGNGPQGNGPQGNEFHFHEDGSSDGARFTLLSQDGFSATVDVAPMTGRVVISDGIEQ